MKAELDTTDNLFAGIFLLWVLLIIPMMCPWVMVSDSFFGIASSILPAIFLGSVLTVDLLLVLGIPARRGLVISTRRRRAFLVISVLGCLLSAFWSFGFVQYASHGYGSDFYNTISWIVLPLSLLTMPASVGAFIESRS